MKQSCKFFKFVGLLLVVGLLFAALPTGQVLAAYDVPTAIQMGADRLVFAQTDGYWVVPDTLGVIGTGMSKAHARTGDADHLASLQAAGAYLLTKTNNFSPSDGLLAAELDALPGGGTYRNFVKTMFFDKLAAGAYGGQNTAAYIATLTDYLNSNDPALGLMSAFLCGASDVSVWAAAVKSDLNGLDLDGYDFDYLIAAKGLYSLASVGEIFDPTAGAFETDTNLADIAARLATLQNTDGSYWMNLTWSLMPADVSTTAYALLALDAVNSTLYQSDIQDAGNWLLSVQDSAGYWFDFWRSENNADTALSIQAIDAAFPAEALCATACYVAPTGSDTAKGNELTPFATIQAAINSVAPNGIVHVAAGTYAEQLTINKAISLLGPNAGIAGNGARQAEAVVTFPDGLTGTGRSVVTIESDGVTINGLKFEDKAYLQALFPVHIYTLSANNLTIKNNLFIGSDIPIYRDPYVLGYVYPDNTGWLIENNKMVGGPFVNSGLARGMYIYKTGATIQNNVIEEYAVGIQILPATAAIGGVVENNTIAAGHIGLYHNGHDKGAGAWSYSGNTITVAANDRSAQSLYSPILAGTAVNFRAIHITNFGNGGTGTLPTVTFTHNVANLQPEVGSLLIGREAIRVNGTSAAGTIATLEHNSFENYTIAVNNTTVTAVDASPNWWGNAAGPAAGSIVGPANYVPWCLDATCNTLGFPDGTVHGVVTTSQTLAVSGTLTGTYNLTITGQVTAYDDNRATFTGTVSGDIVGDITASINEMGIGTLSGIITNTGAILPVRILGIFPKSGITGDFVGQVIIGSIPPLATSMAITTPGDVSTVFASRTLQLGVVIDPVTAEYGEWSIWEPEGTHTDSTISETGLLTAGTPGTITVIAKALDGSLLHATKAINIQALPPTKLLMDPVTITTTDTCTGTHEVFVKVQAVTDLVAYSLNLNYDADLITVTNVENVGLVGGEAAPLNSFAAGIIKFGWSVMGGAGNPVTINGDASLIKITFQSKGLAGTGAFTIQPTSLLVHWDDVQPIPFEVTGGATVSLGGVVKNVNTDVNYCDLAVAVAQATSGDTLRAEVDFETTARVNLNKTIIFNTNGHTITRNNATSAYDSLFYVNGSGNLTVNGGGTLDSTSETATNLGAAIQIAGPVLKTASVTLEAGTTLSGDYASIDIYRGTFTMTGGTVTDGIVMNTGGTANITGGSVIGHDAAISSNSAYSSTNVTIGGTAVIDGGDGWAIYHPQRGNLNINGGTITGATGIEMRSGNLTITGTPTIIGTAGDAIFMNGNTSGYTGLLSAVISGGNITSTGGYALHETAPATTRTSNISVTGGFFTGSLGAVTFTTVDPAVLKLTDGAYNTDPGVTGTDFVFTPYDSYWVSPWFLIDPVDITATTLDGTYTAGLPTTVTITVAPTNHTGPFEVVFTYPAGTLITYGEVNYLCIDTGCPAIPVTLSDPGPTTLSFAVTLASAGTYNLGVALNHNAGVSDIRLLDSASATGVVVSGNFVVTGTFSMQARSTRAGIPVTLDYQGLVAYADKTGTTINQISYNLVISNVNGGNWLLTTLQPRYLNVIIANNKIVSVDGNETLIALQLKGGNADWTNNVIDVNDASRVGSDYSQPTGVDGLSLLDGDVNFDGKVNVQDLALVGGNFDLTSEVAYGVNNVAPWTVQ